MADHKPNKKGVLVLCRWQTSIVKNYVTVRVNWEINIRVANPQVGRMDFDDDDDFKFNDFKFI